MYRFGEWLSQFRKREKMSQQELADQMGKSRNTISCWERSIYLPGEREDVLKLAEILSLGEEDTNNLLIAAQYLLENWEPRGKRQIQKTKEQWLYEARLLNGIGNHEDALVAYEEVLRLDPDNAIAYYEQGNAFYQLKECKKSLEVFKHALSLGLKNASTYNCIGDALYQLRCYQEALEAYQFTIDIDPRSAVYYYNKAEVLQRLGHLSDAMEACRKALFFDPINVCAHTKLGDSLRALRRDKEAVIAYDQALKLNPNFADAHFGRGLALRWLNRDKEALVAYDQAAYLNPSLPVHHYRASSLIRLGRLEEAEVARQASMQSNPDANK
jgi:tetratricopeptide (TPR) repeat protein